MEKENQFNEAITSLELLDELDDMIYISDPDTYDLLYVNDICKKLCQIPDDRYKGQKCYQVLYGQNSPCEFCPISSLTHGETYSWSGFNSRTKRFYNHKDKLILLGDKDAHLQYSVDMTEQKKIENELLISEQRFNIAMDNSDRSLFDVDLMTHTQYNRRLNYPLEHFQKLQKNAPESIIEAGLICPDSIDEFRNLYLKIYSGDSSSEADIQIMDANASPIWCHFILTTIFRKDGTPLRAIGVCEDISKQKKLSIKYKQTKEYQAILLKDSLLFMDINLTKNTIIRKEQHSDFNLEFEPNASAGNLIRQLAAFCQHSGYKDQFLQTFSRTNLLVDYDEGNHTIALQHRITIHETTLWVSSEVQLMEDTASSDVRCIFVMKNIDEQKTHELDLLHKMQFDEDTGLYNVNAYSSKINQYLAKQEADQYSVLIVIQLGNFSSLFSKYGGALSVQYINSFATKLKSLTRSGDFIGRIGENKFAVFAMNLSSATSARDIVKNQTEALKEFFYGEEQIILNLGYACTPFDGMNYADLYHHAEEALQNAIKEGHGHYACYQSNQDKLSVENDVFTSLEQSTNRIKEYEKTHKVTQYDDSLLSIGNNVFSKMKRFTFSMLMITVIVTAILFITLIFGLYTDLIFENGALIARILWIILHIVLLILIWVRTLYYFRKSSTTDLQTGGFNQYYFESHAPSFYQREGMKFAIIYTNLTSFKLFNDQYGKDVADYTLSSIHRIYEEEMLAGEICAHIKADNFALLLHCNTSYQELENRLKKIDDKIKNLTDQNHNPLRLKTSYGIYLIEDSTVPVAKMIDRAELAEGLSSPTADLPIGIYTEEYKQKLQYEQMLENRMQAALNQNEFEVCMQPRCNTTTLKIEGAEALIRWHLSPNEVLHPEEFLPIFEKNGFVAQTDLYVFETICRTLHQWIDQGIEPIPISLNLSRINLEIPNFLEVYQEKLKKYNIPDWMIEFEFTEILMYEDREKLVDLINQIHNMKCFCTIDDFGSGYSSLNMLQSLPVDRLKLEKSFMQQIIGGNPDRSRQITKSILELAKILSLTTICEGIENEEQLEFLRNVGLCDQIQGYLISKAISIHEFEKILNASK